MTIEKARKLLGEKSANLTDEEVNIKVEKMRSFAKALVESTLLNIDTMGSNDTSSNSSQGFLNQTSYSW